MKLVPRLLAVAGVRLHPIDPTHREGLRAAAADPAIWRWWPRPPAHAPAAWDQEFDWWLSQHAAGLAISHTVEAEGRLVGQTSYLNIRPDHAGVEIGATWYAPDVQGGRVNPACKLALLDAAFAAGAERVELKTDALNAKSRAAILKMGATFEGIHRRHMLRPDGTYRDTAWFSVIREDWPAVKIGLERRLGLAP
ncbi:MAG: GNAT family N-acetyltransferase [Alphaproteobacteria bacterium]|nr:GNAT family N-acetyltransferase [Alphaproteobacteria bacterium]